MYSQVIFECPKEGIRSRINSSEIEVKVSIPSMGDVREILLLEEKVVIVRDQGGPAHLRR